MRHNKIKQEYKKQEITLKKDIRREKYYQVPLVSLIFFIVMRNI